MIAANAYFVKCKKFNVKPPKHKQKYQHKKLTYYLYSNTNIVFFDQKCCTIIDKEPLTVTNLKIQYLDYE